MEFQLRDYQIEAVKSIWEYFKTHKEGNPVIALPTGTGKSLVIADFLIGVFRSFPNQKVLITSHVKELVHQDREELVDLWPTAPAGIYSAGLGKKDTHQNIIFCGIASIVKKIEAFGRVDLMIVDECHLISLNEESMYMRVIKLLKERNPNLRVIGLTATPWRQGQGRITEGGGLFTDMCIDLTDMQSFNRFVKEGYLLPLVSKPTQLLLDTTGVKLIGGEFNEKQLDLAVNKDHITYAALQETMQYSQDRRSWIVFATSIDHALKIEQMLQYLGVSCRVVHSKMAKGERDRNIQDWKDLKFTAIINMGILTTGINHPALDLIVMLRPTMSTVLWVQMLGRGTRPLFIKEGYNLTTVQGRLDSIAASAKQYCLVMDFAGNIKRLGPVNDPVLPRKKGQATGEVPVKICDLCGNYNHISARYCGGEPRKTVEGCGAEFTFRVQIKQQASTEAVMKTDMPVIEDFRVSTVTCSIHKKPNKPDSVKVTYYCLNKKFSEYLLIEHGPYFRQRAETWWKRRSRLPLPSTSHEAVELVPTFEIPTHIRVWTNTAFPKVMDECFMGEFANNLPINDDDIPF